jgi:2-oxoglutarate ferredoxin oxidoreductase subunit delta
MAKLWRKPFDTEAKTTKPAKVIIEKDRCKGCGYCAEYCPLDVLAISQEINSKGYTVAAVVDGSKCLGCGLCEAICPEFAIKVNCDRNLN